MLSPQTDQHYLVFSPWGHLHPHSPHVLAAPMQRFGFSLNNGKSLSTETCYSSLPTAGFTTNITWWLIA